MRIRMHLSIRLRVHYADARIRLHLRMKSAPKILEEEEFLTGPELANFYRVDPATVRRWRAQGMPCHRRGYKLIHYKLSEVRQWFKTRRVKEVPA
jgi:Helix-turn-helix domain